MTKIDMRLLRGCPTNDSGSICRERWRSMAGQAGKLLGMDKLKAQNLLVAGGLTSFVGAVYFYTMKAVGSGDDLEEAVQILEQEKKQEAQAAASPSTATS